MVASLLGLDIPNLPLIHTHVFSDVCHAILIGHTLAAADVLRNYLGVNMNQDVTDTVSAMQRPARPEKHVKTGDAGSGMIGILEICMSRLAKYFDAEPPGDDDAGKAGARITLGVLRDYYGSDSAAKDSSDTKTMMQQPTHPTPQPNKSPISSLELLRRLKK